MSAAGLYNRIIEIYKPTATVNAVGSTTVSWTLSDTTRANVRHLSQSRAVQENEVFYPTTKEFIVRSYVDIQDTYRIKYDGKYYRMVNIDRRKEMNDIDIIADIVNE